MENENNVAGLLLNKDCPFDYKCRAMDCMECMNIYMEEGNDDG
jgi:hypothetical protein